MTKNQGKLKYDSIKFLEDCDADQSYSDVSEKKIHHLKIKIDQKSMKAEFSLEEEVPSSTKLRKTKISDPKKKRSPQKIPKVKKDFSFKTNLSYTSDDEETDQDEEISPKKQDIQEAIKELRCIAIRMFGVPTSISFNISVLKDFHECKPSNVLLLTPLKIDDIKPTESKWNIYLKKDFREYDIVLSDFYSRLALLTQQTETADLSEIFVIITSDKVSFDKIKKSLETDEKRTVDMRVMKKKIKEFGIFLLYLASYEVPSSIETLGMELELTVKLERFQ